MSKLDIKDIAIICLGLALIISFIFGQRNKIDYHSDEIAKLHKSNEELLFKNDSIRLVNDKLDVMISEINKTLLINNQKLSETQIKLDVLNKRKNEIPTYVKHLSANDVSNSFSDYIEKRTKGKNRN